MAARGCIDLKVHGGVSRGWKTDKAISPHPTDPPSSPSSAGYFILLVLVLIQVLSLFLWLVVGEQGLKEKMDMEQNGHGCYERLRAQKQILADHFIEEQRTR